MGFSEIEFLNFLGGADLHIYGDNGQHISIDMFDYSFAVQCHGDDSIEQLCKEAKRYGADLSKLEGSEPLQKIQLLIAIAAGRKHMLDF